MTYQLTEQQIEVLRDGAKGTCIRGIWHWTHNHGEPCGRIVNGLVKRGLMDQTYYRGGEAGAWKTEAGRHLLDELDAQSQ